MKAAIMPVSVVFLTMMATALASVSIKSPYALRRSATKRRLAAGQSIDFAGGEPSAISVIREILVDTRTKVSAPLFRLLAAVKGRTELLRAGRAGEQADAVAFYGLIKSHLTARGPFALLLVDIDKFRSLRGIHGCTIADALLRQFAATLREYAGVGSIVAHLNEDMFGIILPGGHGVDLRLAGPTLLKAMGKQFDAGGQPCHMSFCIGAALLPDAGATRAAAVSAAYAALEQAKHAGGGTCRVFDSDQAAASHQQKVLLAQMPAALEAGEFIPYFQPIVALDSGTICGFEVLARWAHPQLGLLPPSEFMDIAEAQSLCGQLSLCLIRHVAREQVAWPQYWRFAFNASPGQLQELIDFVRDPNQHLNTAIAPSRLDLEITESALIGDLDLARAVVSIMHAGGAGVALDDFGTGYANFAHLRQIPFDNLKIDKSFIKDMLTDPRAEACVRAIIALGKSLGMTVTAEGVECRAAAEKLRAMGCTHAQGYYYAAPLPAEAVTVLAECTGFDSAVPLTAAALAQLPEGAACSRRPAAYLRPPCNTNTQPATTP
jgi:predicted signal transduction protein with EAL and GGDEF domain